MAISNRTELRSAINAWLVRSETDARLDELIAMAESSLRRDPRVRVQRQQAFTLDSQEETLPSEFKALESLYLDGPSFYGEIDIVDPGELGEVERRVGDTGTPRVAAIIDQMLLRLAPVPDQAYTARLSYWANIERLSDSTLSNWLLDSHPDIYLYACLVESAPYLKDDSRLQVWRSELEQRLEELHFIQESSRFSGSLVKQPRHRIP